MQVKGYTLLVARLTRLIEGDQSIGSGPASARCDYTSCFVDPSFSVAATLPLCLGALPGRSTRTGAICSTFSQRAVATSFERTTVWRLRFLVMLYRSRFDEIFGRARAKGIFGQFAATKKRHRRPVLFNPHYLTACLFLQVSVEAREERMRRRQLAEKFRGLQSARGRGLKRILQIAVRDPRRSYLGCHLVT